MWTFPPCRWLTARWIVTLAGLSLAGCALTPPAAVREARLVQHAAAAAHTDAAFATLNRLLPGFGGLVRKADGAVQVRLTDMEDTADARRVLSAYLQARQAPGADASTPPAFIFERGAYTWFDLLDHRDALIDALALPKVVYLDADEACNCVTVAVSSAEARPDLEKFIGSTSVPAAAVRIVERAPVAFAQTLRDEFRPIKGGVRMKFNLFLSAGPICTATAVAESAGTRGLIINSHCTRALGGVERTEIYQSGSAPFGFDQVAEESIDPDWTASMPGCPASRRCRLSDSAFATLGNQPNGALGRLARPAAMCGDTVCSVAMNNASDELTIVGKSGAPVTGDVLGKIGQTTGFTSGAVGATCVTVNVEARSIVDPANLTLMCQDVVNALLGRGDSGAPVISLLAGNKAVLAGIAWGRSDTIPPDFVFSRISAVESELGPLQFFAGQSGGGGRPPPPRNVCAVERDRCMREVSSPGEPRPQQCVRDYRACTRGVID
jgi:hypothetical protein